MRPIIPQLLLALLPLAPLAAQGWIDERPVGPVSYTHLTLPTNREV